TDAPPLMGWLSRNDATQTTSPCIHSAGVTPTTPHNPTPAGACITQVRSGNVNVPVQNALGSIGSTPALSPKLQYNLRGRYNWCVNEYSWLAQLGLSQVEE